MMRLDEFDYELPRERVAQYPAAPGESRLLVLAGSGAERHRRIRDLPALLRPGDLLVVNDTRVLPARLHAHRRPGGGRIELLLVERLGAREWSAMARPGRRLKPGVRLALGEGLELTVCAAPEPGLYRLRSNRRISPTLDRIGHMPLPPYIRRPDEPTDRERYQTVFAKRPGSVAAPTAGLHFTPDLLTELGRRGVEITEVTLHIGPGTFQPVRCENVEEHRMQSERFEVSPAAAAAVDRARRRGGRVVAVGTTVVRTLETLATGSHRIRSGTGRTELFIRPGHRFQVVDLLLTNFHLPRSTLLMLVCALGGRRRVLAAYREAVELGYRFYSYGDAMLVQAPP